MAPLMFSFMLENVPKKVDGVISPMFSLSRGKNGMSVRIENEFAQFCDVDANARKEKVY